MMTLDAQVHDTYHIIVCRLNHLHFAVPLNHVQQLIVRPTDLGVIPRRDHAIVGIFNFHGQATPLLDLRRWLPWPLRDQELTNDAQQVLLLQAGQHLLGILIDAIEGIHALKPDQIQRVIYSEDQEELFHSTINVTAKSPVSQGTAAISTIGLLDIPALLALSKIWIDTNTDIPTDLSASKQTSDAKIAQYSKSVQLYASFTIDDHMIAFDALEVAAVLPMPPIQKILGADANWLGMVKWRNRDVPILATLRCLGLEEKNAINNLSEQLLLILIHQGRCVALPINKVNTVGRIDSDNLQSADSAGLPSNGILQGVCHLGNQRILMISGASLIMNCPMSALSELDQQDKDKREQRQNLNKNIFVIVQAGNLFAINIQSLVSIINLPDAIHQTINAHPAQIGNFMWNQSTLALWDLKQMNAYAPIKFDAETRILIARVDDKLIGLLVEQLILLLPGRAGQVHNFSTNNTRTSQIITVKYDDHIKSYNILELDNLTELLTSTNAMSV